MKMTSKTKTTSKLKTPSKMKRLAALRFSKPKEEAISDSLHRIVET